MLGCGLIVISLRTGPIPGTLTDGVNVSDYEHHEAVYSCRARVPALHDVTNGTAAVPAVAQKLVQIPKTEIAEPQNASSRDFAGPVADNSVARNAVARMTNKRESLSQPITYVVSRVVVVRQT